MAGVQTYNLFKFTIMPGNPCFKSFKDEFIIGKSSLENDVFDLLVFSVRNIIIASIPDFIESIGPYSFEECHRLSCLIFEGKSKLKKIENNAFSLCSLQTVTIPTHLNEIGPFGFCCSSLTKIEINENSELQTIGEYALESTRLISFSITRHIKKIGNGAFARNKKLKIIEVSEFSELEQIDLNMLDEFSDVMLMAPVKFKDKIILLEKMDEIESF